MITQATCRLQGVNISHNQYKLDKFSGLRPFSKNPTEMRTNLSRGPTMHVVSKKIKNLLLEEGVSVSKDRIKTLTNVRLARKSSWRILCQENGAWPGDS
jgi:hypothetical protein